MRQAPREESVSEDPVGNNSELVGLITSSLLSTYHMPGPVLVVRAHQ